jgi:hypothetical protein
LKIDFEKVCEHLGLVSRSAELPHVNRSRLRRCYTEYYDDESRAFIAEYYKKDIELFGYSFES